MARVEMHFRARAEDVFRVLANGWLYAHWVAGAKHIHEVDPAWPKPGTRFVHSVGAGPAATRDFTQSLEVEPNRRLVLWARAWPSGEARVTLQLIPQGDHTRVIMDEVGTRGPALLFRLPVLSLAIRARNLLSLERLRRLAEHEGVEAAEPTRA